MMKGELGWWSRDHQLERRRTGRPVDVVVVRVTGRTHAPCAGGILRLIMPPRWDVAGTKSGYVFAAVREKKCRTFLKNMVPG